MLFLEGKSVISRLIFQFSLNAFERFISCPASAPKRKIFFFICEPGNKVIKHCSFDCKRKQDIHTAEKKIFWTCYQYLCTLMQQKSSIDIYCVTIWFKSRKNMNQVTRIVLSTDFLHSQSFQYYSQNFSFPYYWISSRLQFCLFEQSIQRNKHCNKKNRFGSNKNWLSVFRSVSLIISSNVVQI